MKLFIATPAYDGKVTAAYSYALMGLGSECARAGVDFTLRIIKNGCFIEIARSVLVKMFLESDCTHIMFIDADIGFSPTWAPLTLAASGYPVTCGLYRKREEEITFNGILPQDPEVENGWLHLPRVGTGFLCIQRKALEKMSEQAEKVKIPQNGLVPMVFHTKYEDEVFTGEDYCFCDDYMALYHEGHFDHPIYAYVDITFDHDGYLGNVSDYL